MGDSHGCCQVGLPSTLTFWCRLRRCPLLERHELGETGASLWWRWCSLKTATHGTGAADTLSLPVTTSLIVLKFGPHWHGAGVWR